MRWLRRLRYLLSRPARRQTCKDCWRNDGLDFHVTTEVWNAVVAPRYETYTGPSGLPWTRPTDLTSYVREGWPGVLCLACFDKRAERRGVNYMNAVRVHGSRWWMA